MNIYGSDLYDDLAGRNGVAELEDSLAILERNCGEQIFRSARRYHTSAPWQPLSRMLRFNTTTTQVDGHDGTNWIRFLDSRDL